MTLRYAVPLSFAAILAASEWEIDPLGFLAIGWLAWLMAARLRPSLRHLLSERRPPGWDHGAALVIGSAGAIMTLFGLGTVGSLLWSLALGRTTEVDVNMMLTAAWALATVAVVWRDLRSAAEAQRQVPVLWPSAWALIAAAPLGLGLLLLSGGMVGPVIDGAGPLRAVVQAAYLAPIAVGLLAVGAGVLAQAWTFRRDVASVVRWAMTAQLATWVALLAGLGLNLSGLFGPSIGTASGGFASAAFAVPVALAWITALWRSRRRVVAGPLSATLILILIGVVAAVSLAIPAALLETQWPEFVAFLLVLPGLAIVGGVALLLPLLVRWLAWDAARPPWQGVVRRFQRV